MVWPFGMICRQLERNTFGQRSSHSHHSPLNNKQWHINIICCYYSPTFFFIPCFRCQFSFFFFFFSIRSIFIRFIDQIFFDFVPFVRSRRPDSILCLGFHQHLIHFSLRRSFFSVGHKLLHTRFERAQQPQAVFAMWTAIDSPLRRSEGRKKKYYVYAEGKIRFYEMECVLFPLSCALIWPISQ